MLDLSNAKTNTKLSDVKQGQFFCFCVEDPEYTNNAGKEVDASSMFMMIGVPGYLKVKNVNHPQDETQISKKQFKNHVVYNNNHTANVHHCHGDEYVYVVKGVNFTIPV